MGTEKIKHILASILIGLGKNSRNFADLLYGGIDGWESGTYNAQEIYLKPTEFDLLLDFARISDLYLTQRLLKIHEDEQFHQHQQHLDFEHSYGLDVRKSVRLPEAITAENGVEDEGLHDPSSLLEIRFGSKRTFISSPRVGK